MSGPPPRAPNLLHQQAPSWPYVEPAMKAKTLEYMIAIKQAELRDVANLLRWEPSIARLFPPNVWVERLAEISRLHNYTGRLNDSFEAMIWYAHVPRTVPRHKTTRNAG